MVRMWMDVTVTRPFAVDATHNMMCLAALYKQMDTKNFTYATNDKTLKSPCSFLYLVSILFLSRG